ncbi:mannosyltransferase [Hasllibacter halocynthiae]|uniref:Mannosyltransferase n=1 Tax=Hasllibacter halocynthiae TaxID=595589 RepID=A0A2T0X1M1_9RHOB|nr:glycosyltransferase family 4 protein [Hasllibacter halocynthiae]PRY92754.1 mannosyltransferase [Hasllibacter halocynthiae]
MDAPELFVTNFNPRYTGVSSTAARLIPHHARRHALRLVGHPLPGCPAPIPAAEAARLCRTPPPGRPFAIWHVRRNPEMRVALWLRDVRRLPIRLVFTSASQRRHSAYPRWLIGRMDAVIATSPGAAAFVRADATIPHGVDTARFVPDPAATPAAAGLAGTRAIVAVGRLRPGKGTDLFVEAAMRLLPRHPGLVAVACGRAQPRHARFVEGLKAKAAAAGLGDRILWPGDVPAERMPALLAACDLMLTLPRSEPYGVTPLEGMAAGLPFVASDTGAFRSFAEAAPDDEACGVIVPPGEEGLDAAAAAADAILSDPARHAAMRRTARAVAVERFSIKGEAAGIEEVYRRLWAGEIGSARSGRA